MTITNLIDNLTKIKDRYGDLELCYSTDDEGNSYGNVNYEPTPGKFYQSDFTDINSLTDSEIVTHVCIN